MIYPNPEESVIIHSKILEISEGKTGISEPGYLKSVLELIQNDTYYLDFPDKLTHICFGVNKNHAFIDENKRAKITNF